MRGKASGIWEHRLDSHVHWLRGDPVLAADKAFCQKVVMTLRVLCRLPSCVMQLGHAPWGLSEWGRGGSSFPGGCPSPIDMKVSSRLLGGFCQLPAWRVVSDRPVASMGTREGGAEASAVRVSLLFPHMQGQGLSALGQPVQRLMSQATHLDRIQPHRPPVFSPLPQPVPFSPSNLSPDFLNPHPQFFQNLDACSS